MNSDHPFQWLQRTFSSDSLPHSLQPTTLALRKRHSTYSFMSTPNPNPRRPSVPVAKREDITPWEFQSTPPSHFTPASVRARTSLPAGMVEEVTPWELYPAPDMLESSSRKSKHLRAGRRLSSSGTSKALQEVNIIGSGRKSTGSKNSSSSRVRIDAAPSTSSLPLHHPAPPPNHAPPATSDIVFNDSFNYSSIFSASSTSIRPPSPSPPDSMPRSPLPSKFLALKKTPSTSKLDPTFQNGSGDRKFSTADRKILHELQLSRTVREAQFVKKGKGISFGTNGTVPGKKHHSYPRRHVPYPRNYERDVLDLDVWETTFCHDLCGSVTWHVFKTPPTKVLDLGCGTGSWILNCAKVWKACQFVGLDIVPLQPDLSLVGSPDLKSRITWIHANFLDKLPFPDGEFDYVHVKRIALGVPEDKWDSLLEEITRVMKPSGAFELIEEDLFFPGKLVDSDESEAESDETRSGCYMPSFREAEVQLAGSSNEIATSRPESPVPIRERTIVETEELDEEVRDYEVVRLPPNSTLGRLPSRPKISQDAGTQSYTRPSMTKRSSSTLSLPKNGPSLVKLPVQSIDPNGTHHIPMPQTIAEDMPSSSPTTLLRSPPKPPDNPRDHWLLEKIYSEMLSSRFINIYPLSLLTNSLSLYFKDLRTHPAIQFTFPPLPPRKYRVFGQSEERKKPEEAQKKKKVDYQSSDGETCGYETETDGRSKVLSMQSLLQHESRYVSLDETQPSAFSPSARVEFPDLNRDMKMAAIIKRGSRLPNAQLHLDLNTLNLQLALRTEEVLACSESMWEWVTTEKDRIALSSPDKSGTTKPRSSMSSNESGKHGSFRDRIVDMTREDFDELLLNFKFDMQDKFSLGYGVTSRFDWSISLCQAPPDRATFDAACEKWRSWEKRERHAATERSQRSSAHMRSRAISSSNLSQVSSTSSTATSSPQVVRAHSGQSNQSVQSGQTLLSGHSAGSSTLVPPISERWDQQSQSHLLRRSDLNGSDYGHHVKSGRPRGSSCTTHIPPTARMSRALKVFVGWKP